MSYYRKADFSPQLLLSLGVACCCERFDEPCEASSPANYYLNFHSGETRVIFEGQNIGINAKKTIVHLYVDDIVL
jgi:hypothetical protein